MFPRCIHLSLVLTLGVLFLNPPNLMAQDSLVLPKPGAMVYLSPAYQPAMIKGLTVHPENPFLFDFIVDTSQDKLQGQALKDEGQKLVKYFLAALTLPEKDLWVNLSPYEKNRTVPETLGQTDMGRDLLAQDYLLKQVSASLMYPQAKIGEVFWAKVYQELAKQQKGSGPFNAFGPLSPSIPIKTFNKVWIMADKAEVFVKNNTAFVVSCHLKVMLEEDYVALNKSKERATLSKTSTENQQNLHSEKLTEVQQKKETVLQVIRSIILPELEREVNTGKNFAPLRQITQSLVLANWYKKNLKEALLNQVYANQSKVKGIDLLDKGIKEKIYQQYLAAYKKGVFNYVQSDVTIDGQVTARKYFAGGWVSNMDKAMIELKGVTAGRLNDIVGDNAVRMTVLTNPSRGMDKAMAYDNLGHAFVKLREMVSLLQAPDKELTDRELTRRRVYEQARRTLNDIIVLMPREYQSTIDRLSELLGKDSEALINDHNPATRETIYQLIEEIETEGEDLIDIREQAHLASFVQGLLQALSGNMARTEKLFSEIKFENDILQALDKEFHPAKFDMEKITDIRRVPSYESILTGDEFIAAEEAGQRMQQEGAFLFAITLMQSTETVFILVPGIYFKPRRAGNTVGHDFNPMSVQMEYLNRLARFAVDKIWEELSDNEKSTVMANVKEAVFAHIQYYYLVRLEENVLEDASRYLTNMLEYPLFINRQESVRQIIDGVFDRRKQFANAAMLSPRALFSKGMRIVYHPSRLVYWRNPQVDISFKDFKELADEVDAFTADEMPVYFNDRNLLLMNASAALNKFLTEAYLFRYFDLKVNPKNGFLIIRDKLDELKQWFKTALAALERPSANPFYVFPDQDVQIEPARIVFEIKKGQQVQMSIDKLRQDVLQRMKQVLVNENKIVVKGKLVSIDWIIQEYQDVLKVLTRLMQQQGIRVNLNVSWDDHLKTHKYQMTIPVAQADKVLQWVDDFSGLFIRPSLEERVFVPERLLYKAASDTAMLSESSLIRKIAPKKDGYETVEITKEMKGDKIKRIIHNLGGRLSGEYPVEDENVYIKETPFDFIVEDQSKHEQWFKRNQYWVLIAEDIESELGILSKALEEHGYNFIVTRNGLQARQVFESRYLLHKSNPELNRVPDLIISDWQMPIALRVASGRGASFVRPLRQGLLDYESGSGFKLLQFVRGESSPHQEHPFILRTTTTDEARSKVTGHLADKTTIISKTGEDNQVLLSVVDGIIGLKDANPAMASEEHKPIIEVFYQLENIIKRNRAFGPEVKIDLLEAFAPVKDEYQQAPNSEYLRKVLRFLELLRAFITQSADQVLKQTLELLMQQLSNWAVENKPRIMTSEEKLIQEIDGVTKALDEEGKAEVFNLRGLDIFYMIMDMAAQERVFEMDERTKEIFKSSMFPWKQSLEDEFEKERSAYIYLTVDPKLRPENTYIMRAKDLLFIFADLIMDAYDKKLADGKDHFETVYYILDRIRWQLRMPDYLQRQQKIVYVDRNINSVDRNKIIDQLEHAGYKIDLAYSTSVHVKVTLEGTALYKIESLQREQRTKTDIVVVNIYEDVVSQVDQFLFKPGDAAMWAFFKRGRDAWRGYKETEMVEWLTRIRNNINSQNLEGSLGVDWETNRDAEGQFRSSSTAVVWLRLEGDSNRKGISKAVRQRIKKILKNSGYTLTSDRKERDMRVFSIQRLNKVAMTVDDVKNIQKLLTDYLEEYVEVLYDKFLGNIAKNYPGISKRIKALNQKEDKVAAIYDYLHKLYDLNRDGRRNYADKKITQDFLKQELGNLLRPLGFTQEEINVIAGEVQSVIEDHIDAAMASPVGVLDDALGGIDLRDMAINSRTEGLKTPIKVDQAMIERIKIQGIDALTLQIIAITPVTASEL